MQCSFELEHPIEQTNFALYVLSKHGELKPRKDPRVVNDLKGGSTVLFDFEAVPGEDFRLFVRHDSPVDASADISFESRSLGKWSIARKSNVWQNIASDSLFKFQDSYDYRSKVFEPSTFEIRFQYLSRVSGAKGRDQGVLVPTVVRELSLEDGQGWVQPSDELLQSQFHTVKNDPFLTFVITFHPPPATFSPPTASSSLTTSSLPTTPSSLLTTSSLPTTGTLSTTSTLFTMRTVSTTPTTPTPSSPLLTPTPPTMPVPRPPVLTQPAENPEPAPGSPGISFGTEGRFPSATRLTGPAPISQMLDDELQDALSEYKRSNFLLPPRLVPGFRGKLSIGDFCRSYGLPDDIPPLLAQMGIKDAHGLSSKRLSDLRDKGIAPRSVKMLQLAVIRFSSESRS